MITEILATGDEIRSGSLADTNSAWLAQKLEQAGLEVTRHNCVGDDRELLCEVLKEISKRADIALVTGGLGPTTDDLTSEAAADAARVELVLDQKALDSIENYFSSRNRTMPLSNKKQALIPQGAETIYNPVGTAPGFALKIGKCLFYFMPGVPSEMKTMYSEKLVPHMEKYMGKNKVFNMVKTISTFGLPESIVGEMLSALPEKYPGIKLGLRAKFPEIQVKLYAKSTNEKDLKENVHLACQWIAEKMGDRIFSTSEETMEAVVGKLLKKRNAAIAIAESCTGGLIASRLTDVPGSSDYFLFSGVTYSNESKIKVLGVKEETIKNFGAVSEETAGEMAIGARQAAGADYGLSTSGIAGPDGGTNEKPVGTVCIGLASPEKTETHRFILRFASRSMNKRMFAMKALDLLRLELI
ncbi:Competence-induced protein [Desulfonema limicola]|uniref:CinA-like protein n=1 Tax=Desulfonema limicola TaxID=45656 RepID=A0A975GHZ6_9BACT|nr:competence/damage-inducible protein A [Desulfonema limicola]QTA81253.1 Competence-induced protein [Desulfonema limicola]